jgi:hypothetical protein
MPWDIVRVMDNQHRRLEWLLTEALGDGEPGGTLDLAAYSAFRESMLRHIGIEEKFLLAGLKEARIEFGHAWAIHRDHAALASLLSVEPDLPLAFEVARLLDNHMGLEEGLEGLFAACAKHLSQESLVVSVHSYPQVKPAPWSNASWLPRTVAGALELAEGKLPPPHPHP